MANNTEQEARRLYSCIMHDMHDGVDREAMFIKEVNLVIDREVAYRVRNEKQELLNNLNTGIFFESSNPKPQFVKDCIMHELDLLEAERLNEWKLKRQAEGGK